MTKVRRPQKDAGVFSKQKQPRVSFFKGQQLDAGVRPFFEAKMNAGFGNVVIHNDDHAHKRAEEFEARAFTYNNHIFFNKNEYSPGTAEGKYLLAHELAHVKQNRPVIARKPKEERKAPEPVKETAADKERLKKIRDGFAAQKMMWDDLRNFFPKDVHKLAGSGNDDTVPYLKTDFTEGDTIEAGITVSRSAPIVLLGNKYLTETDAGKRQAALRAELDKIDAWRFDTFRIDDDDIGNATVEGKITAFDIKKKMDYITQLQGKSKFISNAKMQEHIRRQVPSTPMSGDVVLTADGGYQLKYGIITINVLPDVFNADDVSEDGGETSLTPVSGNTYPGTPAYTWKGKNINTMGAKPEIPSPVWTVQSKYGKKADPAGGSGYGYGTRSEDNTAGNTSLRFHEGSHGTVFINYIRDHYAAVSYPEFKGKVGDDKIAFESKLADWVKARDAFKKMLEDANDRSLHEVDCAGKSIVTYYTGQGKTSKVKCP